MNGIYAHQCAKYTQVGVGNVLIAAYGVFSLLCKEYPHCCVWGVIFLRKAEET